ncbi:MAG: hypothetical protein AAF821_00165 [Cyanobacteria bacterium P01_D01_bin.156]
MRLRQILLASVLACGGLACTAGAYAQFFPDSMFSFPGSHSANENLWPELHGVYEDSYNRLEDILADTINEQFGVLSDAVEDILASTLSELGIVDIEQAKAQIHDLLKREHSDFDLYQFPVTQQLTAWLNQVNRAQVESRAHAVIGTTGQQATTLKLEQLQQDIVEVGLLADEAQGDIATQDVLKRVAEQTAINTQILGALHSETIDTRLDTHLQGQVLVDVSEALAAERKQRLYEELATTTSAFYGAASYMLTVTPPEE